MIKTYSHEATTSWEWILLCVVVRRKGIIARGQLATFTASNSIMSENKIGDDLTCHDWPSCRRSLGWCNEFSLKKLQNMYISDPERLESEALNIVNIGLKLAELSMIRFCAESTISNASSLLSNENTLSFWCMTLQLGLLISRISRRRYTLDVLCTHCLLARNLCQHRMKLLVLSYPFPLEDCLSISWKRYGSNACDEINKCIMIWDMIDCKIIDYVWIQHSANVWLKGNTINWKFKWTSSTQNR